MPETEQTREDDLRALLTDAIEVQLAALKAGISFWTEWIEHTSTFVQSATKTLTSINTDDPKSKDVVLELLDAGRASVRALTEIPRHTATHFVEELDKFAAAKANSRGSSRASAGGTSGKKASARKAAPRRRAGRAKA
jgi:hypothetical protein